MTTADLPRANLVLALVYVVVIACVVTLALTSFRLPYPALPLVAILALCGFVSFRLHRLKRPCGHHAIERGGPPGLRIPFIRRTCGICGDQLPG